MKDANRIKGIVDDDGEDEGALVVVDMMDGLMG
jgi:hypothetical protein